MKQYNNIAITVIAGLLLAFTLGGISVNSRVSVVESKVESTIGNTNKNIDRIFNKLDNMETLLRECHKEKHYGN